ncbi:uncharacterized protein LOC666190 isoform X2 [Mus musculus]|uniref:uncharacterized protein LOC666190 isoform X2 n=1 Tax=Mus musculus TaxID=10090 RepID=UPI0007ED9C50|nr:uncharacterized protein LOC666190 isoform X2 [Mus musculus]|eukprot:XP_017169206.1 PREDICTED: RNA polymerase-associated protein LEO1-like isoform X3 [Mus musculus]
MIFKLLILLLRLPSARITGKLSPFGNRLCLFSYDFSEDRILGCSLSILIPELLPLSSMSLHLGKEVYDICKTPLQDNRNHLFIREDTGLRGQAIFQSRLTFSRPYCRDSATYKKMTLSFGNRSSKTQIRILPMADHDPEWLCPDLIKMQRKELRVSTPRKVRLRRKSRRQKRQQRPGRSSTFQKPNLVVEEEEEVEGEDEEGKASIEVATKSRYQGAAKKKQAMSSSDCYRERPGEEKARGLLKAKRFESDRGRRQTLQKKTKKKEES